MFRSTGSLLALALSILSFKAAVVSAAVSTELAPIEVDRSGWRVAADSSQPSNNITLAFDGTTGTFWHSSWSPDVPLPHTVSIDMNNQYVVAGFAYTPRQDGNSLGNIGKHNISTSVDGTNWVTQVTGVWVNDQTVKTTYFTPVIARYVRLICITEASGTGKPYASAADFQVLTNPHATLQRTAWQVSADSAQLSPQSYGAQYAIDGSPNTYYHSSFNGGVLPHYFRIDQGATANVGGLSYLPRPSATGANGRIGQYKVQYSFDGNAWNTIATGTWADTPYQKFVEWTPIVARYWRLISITEAGNRGPFTSASEINLLDGSNNLANFVITVDSEETAAANQSALNALDGNPNSIWHTQYTGGATPFPHFFMIDMRIALPVKALTYLPRQDGGVNGNIGQHIIEVSTDGAVWTTVASGYFADNSDAKVVNFQEQMCRYVRLTATSEAGNRGTWSSASEITLAFDANYIPPLPQTVGSWSMTIDFPVVPVAAGMIPSTGGVVAWSSWNPNGQGSTNGAGGQTATATYNPIFGNVSRAIVTNIDHDMFCPGISADFNGRIVVTGGATAPRTSIYNQTNGGWIKAHDMNLARGYQGQATLSNGKIFTIGGSWSGGTAKKNGEIYDPVTDTWTLLTGADVTPMLTNDRVGLYRADNHGWFFGWKNGTIFQAGPSKAMNWYSTSGVGAVSPAGSRGDSGDAMCGDAVMYDAVAGKILTMGGSPDYAASPALTGAYIVTIGDVNAQAVTQKVTPMAYKRIFASGVALPNGQVLVVGGQDWGSVFNDDSSILYPELYDPTANTWSVMAPMSVARTYHSTALLLTDATVIIMGGGLCDGCQMNHYDGQIFQPPYLFAPGGGLAVRPVITTATPIVAVGGNLIVNTDSLVGSFSIVRMGTNTHTVNTDQRRIPLIPTTSCSTSYTLVIPNDPGIALPGYWMLFAMNAAGVPSVSKTIQITL
jgi:galactose oxidase